MGSCRMGPDPATSVCDRNGAVQGFAGLDVVGNAVIPNPLLVNPTLTAIALAVHGQRSRLG